MKYLCFEVENFFNKYKKEKSKLFVSYFKKIKIKIIIEVIQVYFDQLYAYDYLWYFKKHQQQQQTLKSFTYFQKKIKHAYKHVLVLKHVSAIQIHLYNFFYNLFFNCRTNRKYRSKIIYRIRTCLPFRARIVSTNYHQCWIDDQFEEKALLKVSVTPIIKEFHCTYMFFFHYVMF